MKIIAFISQGTLIEKILRHGGLWQDQPPRGPPRPPTRPDATDPDSRRTVEADPDFLEHCRREQTEQLELPLGS